VRARTPFTEDEVSALTDVYVEALMPGEGKSVGGSEHECAVQAVREWLKLNAEKAKAGPVAAPANGTPEAED